MGKKTILCILMLLLLLTGCGRDAADPTGSPSPAEPEETVASEETIEPEEVVEQETTAAWIDLDVVTPADQSRLYYAYPNNGTTLLAMDRDGGIVQNSGTIFYRLPDADGGEIDYYYRERTESTGEVDEWGMALYAREQALYDAEGNLLMDWAERWYYQGFGEYVLGWGDGGDYDSALYHAPTGQVARGGVGDIVALGDGVYALSNADGLLLGTVDTENRELAGFPVEEDYYYPSAAGAYLVAQAGPYTGEGDPNAVLLNRDLEPLYTFPELSSSYQPGPVDFATYRSGDEWGILDPEAGVVLTLEGEGSIPYFDGEVAVVNRWDTSEMALMAADGTVLRGGLTALEPVKSFWSTEVAQAFIGIIDDQVVLLDRLGEQTASLSLPGVYSVTPTGDGLCIYTMTDGSGNDTSGLLGPELDVLVSHGTYNWIYEMGSYSRSGDGQADDRCPLLQGAKMDSTYMRLDLLSSTGEVLAGNITSIFDAGDDRVLFQRGYRLVMIDWAGNLIAEHSVFHTLGED